MTTRMRSAVRAMLMLACATLTIFIVDTTTSGQAHADPRSCLTSAARNLLGRIENQFGRMQIISTCRPGARVAGTGRPSRHASGNAVDFNAGAKKQAVIQWLLANHSSGGTMTYPRMDHIHVDIGPRFVSLSGTRVRTASNEARPARERTASNEARPRRERVAWQETPRMGLGAVFVGN
jgi:Peptidase M15